MSKTAKSKLKWRYYTGEIHNRYVDPDKFKRLHAPLDNILQWQPEFQDKCVTLRPCEEGVNKDGTVKAVLYCTENYNRFFDQDKNGFWNEQKPNYAPDRPNKKTGGGANYACMRDYGALPCHLLVAHAWVENRYHYIKEVWSEKEQKMVPVCTKQVDHLDTNTLNNNASNLEYVDASENFRRKKITDRLKNKVGINPKLLTPTLLQGIFGLPEEYFEAFIGRYLLACKECEDPMEIWSIRTCVAIALDAMRAETAHELNDLNEN